MANPPYGFVGTGSAPYPPQSGNAPYPTTDNPPPYSSAVNPPYNPTYVPPNDNTYSTSPLMPPQNPRPLNHPQQYPQSQFPVVLPQQPPNITAINSVPSRTTYYGTNYGPGWYSPSARKRTLIIFGVCTGVIMAIFIIVFVTMVVKSQQQHDAFVQKHFGH